MASIRILSLLFSIFASQILSIQFGFLIRDTNKLLNNRFVVFGMIPEWTSAKVKSEILDSLKVYIEEELHRREFEGIGRQTFINEPIILSAVIEGQSFLGLKGELSVFLNIFRFSCKRITPVQATWNDAVFLTEPILTLSFNELGNFMRDVEVTLIQPALQEEDDSLYTTFIRSDTDSTVDCDEESSLITKKENEDKRCCCCTIS